MQFDAGTWWLAVLLLGGLTGALGYMIKHSFDKIEKKLDTAVPKEDFDTKIANHEAQIRKIQEKSNGWKVSGQMTAFMMVRVHQRFRLETDC